MLRLQTTGVPGGGRDATAQDIVDALNANPEVAAEVWPHASAVARVVDQRDKALATKAAPLAPAPKSWNEALALIDEVRSVVFDLQVLGTRPGLRTSEVNARAEDWCRRAQEFDILYGRHPSSSRVADEFPYPQPCGCDARSVVSGCPRHDLPQANLPILEAQRLAPVPVVEKPKEKE